MLPCLGRLRIAVGAGGEDAPGSSSHKRSGSPPDPEEKPEKRGRLDELGELHRELEKKRILLANREGRRGDEESQLHWTDEEAIDELNVDIWLLEEKIHRLLQERPGASPPRDPPPSPPRELPPLTRSDAMLPGDGEEDSHSQGRIRQLDALMRESGGSFP